MDHFCRIDFNPDLFNASYTGQQGKIATPLGGNTFVVAMNHKAHGRLDIHCISHAETLEIQ